MSISKNPKKVSYVNRMAGSIPKVGQTIDGIT